MNRIIIILVSILILVGGAFGIYKFNFTNNSGNKILSINKLAEGGDNLTGDDLVELKTETEVEAENGIEKEEEVKTNKTILILDASGSMWAKIKNKSKIEIARKVVADTLVNFDDSLDLGLMVYGHRRKDDCTDIELIIEPEKNNAEKITQQVNSLQPLGETPMGAAVQQAADYLKYQTEPATIILVSDGIETCDVDICELGKKLELAGVDFTTHVIGFGLKEESTTAMKCLAESTGGTFSLATSESDLEKAFGEIVEASSCSEDLPEITLNFPAEVTTDTEFEVSWTGDSQLGDMISIGVVGMENRNDEISAFAPGSYAGAKKAKLVAPNAVGLYEIVYWAGCGKDLVRQEIRVVENVVTINFPKTVKVGTRFEVSWVGPNTTGDTMLMVPVGLSSFSDKLASFGIASHAKKSKYYLQAPDTAGNYEIIYLTKKRDVLFRGKIMVTN